MLVTFDNLDDYLAELSCTESESPVRASIVKQKVNEGVTSVALVSGYHDDLYFYELTLDCGEDLAGGGDEASHAALVARARIEGFCREKNLSLRGGTWQRPE